jgi:hypothetical protein
MPSYASPYDYPEAGPYHAGADDHAPVRNGSKSNRSKKPGKALRRGKIAIRNRTKPWIRWALSSLLLIGGLSYFAFQQDHLPEIASEAELARELVAPPPRWEPVINPVVLFAFDLPELQLPSMAVRAREYREGGREDTLSIGSVSDPFYLQIVLDRTQQPESSSFYLDLVRSAAQAGLAVTHISQSTDYQTKFGPIELARSTLANGKETSCLAFRGQGLDGSMRLHGWICGDERFVADDMLACFVDRLTTTPAMREPDFEAAMRNLDKSRTPACQSAMTRIGDAG